MLRSFDEYEGTYNDNNKVPLAKRLLNKMSNLAKPFDEEMLESSTQQNPNPEAEGGQLFLPEVLFNVERSKQKSGKCIVQEVEEISSEEDFPEEALITKEPTIQEQ